MSRVTYDQLVAQIAAFEALGDESVTWKVLRRNAITPITIQATKVGLRSDGKLTLVVPGPSSRPMADAVVDLETGECDVDRPVCYPLNWIQFDRPVLLVPSVLDVLACYSADPEANALTVLGAPISVDHLPELRSPILTVALPDAWADDWIAAEVDKARHRLIHLSVLRLGKRTVAGILADQPNERMRKMRLRTLLNTADPLMMTVGPSNQRSAVGLVEHDGRIMTANKREVVAPWTGVVTDTGMERYGAIYDASGKGRRVYAITLRHPSAGIRHIIHRHTDNLVDSMAAHADHGPEWSILPKDSDRVFTFMATTSPACRTVDHGYWFGFDGEDRSVYWTPAARFGPQGAEPQDRVRMKEPLAWLSRFDIPMPDPIRRDTAIEVVGDHLLRCHQPKVTFPLLAHCVGAMLRRSWMPDVNRSVLYLTGISGSGKTSRARVFQALVGQFPDDSACLTWQSSVPALEAILGYVGDLPVLIDDLAQERMKQEPWRAAVAYLQAVAQGVGRIMTTGGAHQIVRNIPEPRSSLIVTCERVPGEDAAMLARGLHVNVPEIDLLAEPWVSHHNRAQADYRLLRQFTAHLLAWAMAADDLRAEWPEILSSASHTARERAIASHLGFQSHPNRARIQGHLAAFLGWWHLIAEFFRTYRGDEFADALLEEAKGPVLHELIRDQFAVHASKNSLGWDIMETIRERIAEGRCRVRHRFEKRRRKGVRYYPKKSMAASGGTVIDVQERLNNVKDVPPEYRIWFNDEPAAAWINRRMLRHLPRNEKTEKAWADMTERLREQGLVSRAVMPWYPVAKGIETEMVSSAVLLRADVAAYLLDPIARVTIDPNFDK